MDIISNHLLCSLNKFLYQQKQYQFLNNQNNQNGIENNQIQSIKNDPTNQKLQNEIKRFETLFDQTKEHLQRNENLLSLQIELIELMDKLKELLLSEKEHLSQENDQLIISNNNYLKTLKQLEEKRMRRDMKNDQ